MHQDLPTSAAFAPQAQAAGGPARGARSIRSRLLAALGIVALMVLASASATVLVTERIGYLAERDRLASAQLVTVTRVATHLNRHSENLAELLLLGRSELEDLRSTEAEARAALADLARLVDREIALVRSATEREAEFEERERVARMGALFEELVGTSSDLLALLDAGQGAELPGIFRARIEDGASAALDAEIAAAIADEEEELVRLQAGTARLRGQLAAAVLGVGLLAVAVSAAVGAGLARTLGRSVAAIVAGARAIGEGDLGHRIPADQPAEFAALARQFNQAAARLEAQRRELLGVQAGLEAEIARRTGELEEANASLQRLDRMRMLFLADVGHELRTPLTVLRGEAEVALRGDRSSEDHRETLRRVVQLAQQMGRLVEDLLFLARSEVGAVRFDMEPLVLQDVLEVALADAQVLASGRGLPLEARAPEEPLRTEGDAGRLAQALLIVLDNAVKYSDPGAPVRVDLSREGGEARLRVENRGPAIPRGDLPFVFSRFWRGRQDPGRRTEGSGLGLPIAKWILDSHGGRIAIESGEGRTMVTLHIPLRP